MELKLKNCIKLNKVIQVVHHADKPKHLSMIGELSFVCTKKADDSTRVYSTSTAAGKQTMAASLKPKIGTFNAQFVI